MAKVMGSGLVAGVVSSDSVEQKVSEILAGAKSQQKTEEVSDMAEKKETVKRDPLSNFKKLDEAQQKMVGELAEQIKTALGGDEIDLSLLMGLLDKLSEAKKQAQEVAKEKAKEEALAEKQQAQAIGSRIAKKVVVGDTVDYLLKSKGLIIKGLKIQKITEKRVHVEILPSTEVVDIKTGKVFKALEIGGLKLGRKFVAFDAIQTVNGMTPSEFLK